MSTTMTPERPVVRRWPTWLFFIAFLIVALESVMIAIVSKGTLFVLLAPGAICWLKAMELWKDVRTQF